MSELRNYCLLTTLPASYSPLHIANFSTADNPACRLEVGKCNVDSDEAAGVSQAVSNGRKSILFNLLNVGPSSSSPSRMCDSPLVVEDSLSSESMVPKMLSVFDSSAYRSRSDSFNSAASYSGQVTLSRTSSGGSLSSSGGGAGPGQSEALVEATRTRLVELSTNNADTSSLWPDLSRCRSQPGTPPSPVLYPEVRRKYSMGSRIGRVYPAIVEQTPVDLSCKRSRYSKATNESGPSGETDGSILKSILTVPGHRERSNTLSVCGSQGVNKLTSRQHRVALAKKTLLPVSARVAELLKRAVEFARSLPEFVMLSAGDRHLLLSNALSRLLVLYMAEEHLQFAVTPAHDDESLHIDYSQSTMAAAARDSRQNFEPPTQQFVDSVQNLIRKCQMLQICANEFFYMRMITLFHTGSAYGSLQQSDVVGRLGAEARQDLQDLAAHQRPSERLRYSNLLLTLHTVFGVNSDMLAALFCRQLPSFTGQAADFDMYVHRELVDDQTPHAT